MQTHRRYDIKTCSWLLKGSFKFLHHASIKVKDIGIPQRLFTRRHVKPVLYLCLDFIWIYSFSTYAKFQKTNISYPLIRTHTCAYQEVKNISYSWNFVSVLNEWSLYRIRLTLMWSFITENVSSNKVKRIFYTIKLIKNLNT